MKNNLLQLLAFASFVFTARADYIFLGDFGNSGLFFDTVGYSFTVQESPLLVSRVGVLEVGNTPGLNNQNLVGIWTDAGSLLSMQLIPAGTSPVFENNFRWVDLSSPLLLEANTTYRVGAQANEERYSGFLPGYGGSLYNSSVSSHVSINGAVRNNQNGVFSFPNTDPMSNSVVIGPNLDFSVVPENKPLGLVLCSLLALVLWQRYSSFKKHGSFPNSEF